MAIFVTSDPLERVTFLRNLSSRRQELILLAGSTILNLIVYGRGLANGFVAEDFNMMALTTLSWAKLWRVLIESSRIKPVPLLLNRAFYPLFGTNPMGYHWVNLVLHAVCTWCVIRLTTLLSGRQCVGIVAGLLFAVYPRHHQPVLWLAANQFVVATLFGLMAFVCFGKYLLRKSRLYYLMTWACSLLAPLTNEAGVMFLFLLPFIEWILMWPTLRQASAALRNWRTYLKYWPLLMILAAFLWLTFGGGRLKNCL